MTHKLYCFGGNSVIDWLDQIVEYTPATDPLVVKAATLPTYRRSLSRAEDSATHRLYCFESGSSVFLNQIVEFSPVLQWVPVD